MAKSPDKAVVDFLCQALETEKGGLDVYGAAIECAEHEELKEEWEKYLEETEEHVQRYTSLLEELGIDPELETPGRKVVRKSAAGLLAVMKTAKSAGDTDAAEIVAAECIALAETKCHANWELVGQLAKKKLSGKEQKSFLEAYEEVHEQENEHLFHTMGWARELWIKRLGMKAVLPPPEEEKDVKTAIGAEKAKNAREEMVKSSKK